LLDGSVLNNSRDIMQLLATRRRKPSLAKSLVDSAIAFMGQAVNLQNATQVSNRHEQVAIAMATAWEKLLKAFLYRKNSKSIYYPPVKVKRGEVKPKRKTISLDDCLAEVNNQLGKSFEPIRMTIEQSSEYRNECIHFYGERLDALLLPLFTQCCLYFSSFIKEHFSRELFSELELAILPLAYQYPFVAETFLTTHNASAEASKEVKDFLKGLLDAGQQLYDNGHTDCILVKYHLALISAKKASDADSVVHVDNAAPAEDTFRIERPVSGDIRLTSDMKAQVVRLSEDDLMQKGYTLSYDNLLQQTKKEGYKWDDGVRSFIKNLKDDVSLCYTRKLNPMSEKSAVTYFYHTDVQIRLMDYLAEHGNRRVESKQIPLFN
jgi:hypothetical protein